MDVKSPWLSKITAVCALGAEWQGTQIPRLTTRVSHGERRVSRRIVAVKKLK